MFVTMLWQAICFAFCILSVQSSGLHVTNSGVSPFHTSDVALVMFVSVEHKGRRPRKVMVQVLDCCEILTEEETDCQVLQFYGGTTTLFEPGTHRNITLVYPTVYVANRKGVCMLDVWHKAVGSDRSASIRHKVEIDTYTPGSSLCSTIDLDPLDGCQPVDCHAKYGGYRNYYNPKARRCQKVPQCVADPKKSLPDVVYVPLSNSCKDMETLVTEEALEQLMKGQVDADSPTSTSEHAVRCHHGRYNNKRGGCLCDAGWCSDQDTTNPTEVQHLCNIWCHGLGALSIDDQVSVFALGLAFIIVLLQLLIIFCCEFYGKRFLHHSPSRQCPDQVEVAYFPSLHSTSSKTTKLKKGKCKCGEKETSSDTITIDY